MRRCSTSSRSYNDDTAESLPTSSADECVCREPHHNNLSCSTRTTNTCVSISVSGLQLQQDSAADAGDAVPLNIDVQSYKKLLEKNLLNDLSSQTCADTLPIAKRVVSMVDASQDQQVLRYEDKACQTTASSVRRAKLIKSLKRRSSHALCFAGWILCCPCWTLGFILRDPPDYYYYYNYDSHHHHHQNQNHSQQQQQQQQQQIFDDDKESTTESDPCWPCDNCIRPKRRSRIRKTGNLESTSIAT